MKLRPQEPVWKEADGAATLGTLPRGDLLLRYQQRTLDRLFNGVSLLVIEKSRRIGLTWGLAAYAVLRGAAQASAGGMNVWYMGYDLEMAREFIETCAMWARAFNVAAEAQDEEIFDVEGEKVQAFRLRLASGFKIVALPSVPRALRGKQGLVIIDEAAFQRDLAEILKAAVALLMWGGQLVVVSTHDGVANPFNLMLDDVRSGRRKGETLTITFKDALDAGLYERVALASKIKGQKVPPKEEWIANIRDTYGEDAEEELDCVPKQGSGSWLNAQDIAACEHPDAGRPDLYSGGLTYIGRDVARRRDLSVIHAYELVGDVLWLRERWLSRGASFREQDDVMDDMMRRYRVAKACIDQTGMGEKVVEDAQRRHGTYRVEGVLLTGPMRLNLATSLKGRVEPAKIRIVADAALRTDWRAIKKQGSAGGAVRLVDDGDVHADEFWAGALACNAADQGGAEYGYQAVPKASRFGDLRAADDDDFTLRNGRDFGDHAGGSLAGQLRRGGTY